MIRKIVEINEDKCTGCGDCVPGCAEGALQIIDGKARLISDLFCDGLGACLGFCPENAITISERDAEPYDEQKVMDYIIKGGKNVILAHLNHLKEHGEIEYFNEAVKYLAALGIKNPMLPDLHVSNNHHPGCPGSKEMVFETKENKTEDGKRTSHLTQWPVQFHLVSPQAAYYRNSDLLLAADCTAFAYADFHKDFLKDRSLAIACPKLDSNKQVYYDKLVTMINEAELKSITVMVMQVPCCSGLLQLAKQAIDYTGSNINLKVIVIGVNGDVLQEAVVQ